MSWWDKNAWEDKMRRWSRLVAPGLIFSFLIFLIPLADAAPNGGTTTRGRTCANRLSGCLSKCDNTNRACRDVCSGGWDDCIDHGGWSTKSQAVRYNPSNHPIYKHPVLTGGTRSESEGFHRRQGSGAARFGETEGYERRQGSGSARFEGSEGSQRQSFSGGETHNGAGEGNGGG